MEILKTKGAKKFTSSDTEDILGFLGDDFLIIAHNYKFDWAVLLQAFKQVGIWLSKFRYVCTQNLAANLQLPESLEDLCTHFGMEYTKKHDALEDARVTIEIWKKLKGALEAL